MIQRLLAMYMSIVLVVGPSLCCCTSSIASTPADSGSTLVPASSPSPCCCHDGCPSEGHDSANQSGRSEHSSDPRKHECPCKDKGGKQALDQPAPPLSADVIARLLMGSVQFLDVDAAAYGLLNSPLLIPSAASPPGHRLTSWRLLHAHHLLRC